jgi:hypothetical protein
MTETSTNGGTSGLARLRRYVPDPLSLSLLGLLALPGEFVPGLEPLQAFAVFFLFALWPLVAALLPQRGTDPRDWMAIGGPAYSRRSVATSLPLLVNPWVQYQSLRQLAGQALVLARYHGRLPSPERYETRTDLRLPFAGEWTVVNGSPERRHSHSWGIYGQRYAHDFVVTDGAGRTHEGDGRRADQYYCWEEPILAPADGVVVEASDGHRDYPKAGGRMDPFQRDIRGNYVVIDHGNGEFSVLAHLREGSVAVAEGDRVRRAQRIGRCGNSGNSTEPHLHYHLQDRASFYSGMGLPAAFEGLTADSGPGTERERRERGYVSVGQRVAPADAGASA